MQTNANGLKDKMQQILESPELTEKVHEEVAKIHAERMKALEPELAKIRAAEHLTAKDYQVIINTRG